MTHKVVLLVPQNQQNLLLVSRDVGYEKEFWSGGYHFHILHDKFGGGESKLHNFLK